jgi:hypothetical protein
MNRNTAILAIDIMRAFPINTPVVWNIGNDHYVGFVVGYRFFGPDTVNLQVKLKHDEPVTELDLHSASLNVRKEV